MHGNTLMKHGEGEETNRPEIDRRDLRMLLLNSFPEHKIRWGTRVDRVQKQDDGKMVVYFADDTSEIGFRLVVGADGAWSKARSLVSFLFIQSKVVAHNQTGHACNTRICWKILPDIEHLAGQPLLPYCRGEGRHRKLP